MKQIISIIRQDLIRTTRDNILLYALVAPLLLSLAATFLFPSLSQAGLNFAVEAQAGEEIIDVLGKYGKVTVYDTREQAIKRVEKVDTVAGVVGDPANITLVLEGNEPQHLQESYKTIIRQATTKDRLVEVNHRSLNLGRSRVMEYITVGLTMLIIAMAAAITGLNIVDERETRAVQAISVAPVTLFHFVAAKGGLSVLISVITAMCSSLIIAGTAVSYPNLLIALLVSAPFTALLAMGLGISANNQITAIPVMKLGLPLYLALPLLSLAVSESWQPLFYVLPNYWQFLLFKDIFVGGENFWLAAALTFSLSVLLFAALSPLLKSRLKLR